MMKQHATAFPAPRALTAEDIDATIERAREQRAETIRVGVESLGLILGYFLSRRCLPLRA